jgi:transcriptional regulator with XRE-family HTH domain
MEAGLTVARQFGKNLRRERKRLDLSQEEVGFRASLHRTEVGLLERGARVPRIDTLIKLASVLGVRIDCALLEGIAWNPASRSARAGGFRIESRIERHRALMEEAAELRAGQKKQSDAAQLVRESREELERRTERWKGEDES